MTTQESLKLVSPRLAPAIDKEIETGGWGPASQMAWRVACTSALKADVLTHRDYHHVSNHQPRSGTALIERILNAALQAEASAQSQHFAIVCEETPIVGIPLRLSLNPTTVAFSLLWNIAEGNATLSATDALDPYVTILDTKPVKVTLKCSDSRGDFVLEKQLQAMMNLDDMSLELLVPSLVVGRETDVEISELEGHEVIHYGLEHNGVELHAIDDTGRIYPVTPERENHFTVRAFLDAGVVSTDVSVEGADTENYKIDLSFSQKSLKADKQFTATASTDFDDVIEGDMVWEVAPALNLVQDGKSNKAKITGPDGEHNVSITVPTQYGEIGRTFVIKIGDVDDNAENNEEVTMTDPNKKDATDAQKDPNKQDPNVPHPDVEAQATQNLNAHKDVFEQVETGSGPDPIAPNPNAPQQAGTTEEHDANDEGASTVDSEATPEPESDEEDSEDSREVNFDEEDSEEEPSKSKGSKKSK